MMDISTFDLEALKQKVGEFYDFAVTFQDAIGRGELFENALPFEDYLGDIARIYNGLERELKARGTRP